eukprot:TRINITY_DN4990_c0_g1_i1.p1 TRINITY_DN4990_c0_g1~~TRINITY_DN4990_c0_g1_i1.p1  ORF type:complete len:375 (+),score=174.58 TRINITY_DN4990_c0_g1_i1:518-1642(+)
MFGGHSIDDLFSPLGDQKDSDAGHEHKKRKVMRKGKEVALDSTNPEDILVTPHYLRTGPKWLDKKRLEDAGLIEVKEEKVELVTTEGLTEEEIEKAEREWKEKGGLPHTGEHERWDSSDEEGEGGTEVSKPARKSALDDPDIMSPNEQYHNKKNLYSFCLNRNCPAYSVKDLKVQQRWDGECCGMRNQPLPDGTTHEPEEEAEEEDEEEDWDITDEDIQAMMKDDPETAQMLAQIRNFYGTMETGVSDPEAASVAAVLSLAAASTPEEEEEEDEEEEEEEEEEDPVPRFNDMVKALLEGMLVAMEGEVVEPFTTQSHELTQMLTDFTEGKTPFEDYKSKALEMVRSIRQGWNTFKREARPPKKNIEIDGTVYDI